MNDSDIHYMRQALTLAENGRYAVRTNPMVGAVLVEDGRIIGEGWHMGWGQAHAEIDALADADRRAGHDSDWPYPNASLYVTLEPCCHHGKTPPCTLELIRRRVGRVVVAMIDPNPLVAGKGIQALREQGIIVETGVLESVSKALNQGFICLMEKGRPYVSVKLAQSLDGKIAAQDGSSKWISNETSRSEVQIERSHHDAILIGANTLLLDNPTLNVRVGSTDRQPCRVIVDPHGRTKEKARTLAKDGQRTILITQPDAPDCQSAELEQIRIETDPKTGRLSAKAILGALAESGLCSVLIEGGQKTAQLFLDEQAVDRLIVFIAPLIIGETGLPSLLIQTGPSMRDSLVGREFSIRLVGDNVRFDLDLPFVKKETVTCLPA